MKVRHLQGGAMLAALTLLLLIGSLAALLSLDDPGIRAVSRAQIRSVEALAQARSALIGYAVSYAESHPGQGSGYLPCPDSANTGSATIGACFARDDGALGRLPYRTLGLADLRDGWGDCLWYAVGGSVKNNPKPQVLNWDSPDPFTLVDIHGNTLTGADAAAAILFAPGRPLDGQSRPSGTGSRCPGSPDAGNDLPHFLDGNYAAHLTSAPVFIQGLPSHPGNNDVLAWITIDDIFAAMRKRSDFATQIDAVIDRAAQALALRLDNVGFLDAHVTLEAGNRASGPLPDAAALGIPSPYADPHDNWRDQFRFVACKDGSTCLIADLTDSAATPAQAVQTTCRALLLFGGERIRTGPLQQSRTTAAERADPMQYLEPPNVDSLLSATGGFAGYRHFSIPDPLQPSTADVIRCLP